jgi:hypothetical protein
LRKAEKVFSDPEVFLESLNVQWLRTRDPSYAWNAVLICRQHSIGFPLWVQGYFHTCAEEIFSGTIQAAGNKNWQRDLARALGFDKERQRVGALGRPRGGKLRKNYKPVLLTKTDPTLSFAFLFLHFLIKGLSASEALKEAANASPPAVAERELKELRLLIRDVFELPAWFKRADEWTAFAQDQFSYLQSIVEKHSK